ncbi:IPT/TIG domain-containing protein [bacterium]|nr:IPT/TIG domain-containing protein [bacterium]
MKKNLLFIAFIAVVAWMNGCEYEVAQPQWNDPFDAPPAPVITQIVPANTALPGANTITIQGENFGQSNGENWVYFDQTAAELVTAGATSITVRRPNLIADSCTVKVVPRSAASPATFGPYAVIAVWERVGGFLENLQLNDVTVDADGNLYVFQNSPRTAFKIATDGTRTELLTETERVVTDAKWTRSGGNPRIILLYRNRNVNVLDLTVSPPAESLWKKVAKNVSSGDFDGNGTFYAGGSKTDLIIVTSDRTEKPAPGFYTMDNITSVRVFGGFVYLAVTLASPAAGDPAVAIWRHAILDNAGNVGPRELVLDWSTTGSYAASVVKDITFSADGTLIVATDHSDPFFMLGTGGAQDVLYKSILPSYPVQIEWGNGNAFYMILGGSEWNLVRVDMGGPGAPYYGRIL